MKLQPKNLSRREFLRLTGAVAAGVALSACAAPQQPRRAASQEPVRLVYQDWRTDWFPALAQEMLPQFHESHPNIRVFYTADPENLEQEMLADMEAGTAPDVFSGCCSFFPAWAQQGYMLDLRPFVEADLTQADIDEWSKAQYQAFFTSDGKQFALPKYHGGLALYYNKDMFDAAGIPYPTDKWTYDEYLAAMKTLTVYHEGKITRWGSMVDVSWDRMQIHINGWGGHFVDSQDPKKCAMSSQPALQAFEWLRARMWDDRVMATSLDVENMETREAFINQKIAMVEDGSWALKDILAQANFRIGVAPFLVGPVRRVTLATTDGFAIYAGTKYPEAAWELLKFLISKDYGRAMARYHFLQPARASIVPDWIEYIRREFPDKAQDINLAAFADGHIHGYSVTTEIFSNMLDVIPIVREAWDKIYTVGQAPVSEMEQVCRKIDAIQQTNQTRTDPVHQMVSCECAS